MKTTFIPPAHYTHARTHTHTHKQTCTHTYTHTHMHAQAHTCMCMHRHIYVHAHMHAPPPHTHTLYKINVANVVQSGIPSSVKLQDVTDPSWLPFRTVGPLDLQTIEGNWNVNQKRTITGTCIYEFAIIINLEFLPSFPPNQPHLRSNSPPHPLTPFQKLIGREK